MAIDALITNGWSQCYKDKYIQNLQRNLETIIGNNCTKAKLMLSCRKPDSTYLNLMAWAPREDVLFDTGKESYLDKNMPEMYHVAHGTAWYYNNDHSWGFAKANDSIHRQVCDYSVSGSDDLRLCWNTNGGKGYRCGLELDPDYSVGDDGQPGLERIIYQKD